MATISESEDPALGEKQEPTPDSSGAIASKISKWRRFFGSARPELPSSAVSSDDCEEVKRRPEKWSLGVLNDAETEEVPGM